jgi:hypothetical protein
LAAQTTVGAFRRICYLVFMQKLLARLDALAQINTENEAAVWLERIAFVFLFLMFVCAPHSIAASQISWLCGLLAWAARFAFRPRPTIFKTPLNLGFAAFLGWAIVSAVCSYAPDISLDRLRSVGLLFVFIFVVNNLRTKRAAVFLSFALIFSCTVGAIWTPVERLLGRGVEVSGISRESPLMKGLLVADSATNYIKDGDTIIRIGKKKISSPEQLVGEIEKNEVAQVVVYRPEYEYVLEIKRETLLGGNSALEKLGVRNWKKSHDWRSAGFYGHFTTYAEVLQLIAALALGILIAAFGGKEGISVSRKLKVLVAPALAVILIALLLTVTRASQAAFVTAALVMLIAGASRRTFIVLIVSALPLILAGLFFLQQTRNVSFYDTNDNSIKWRKTVYREGFDLATESPRHLLVGVGMDSIKRYAKDWHLFDDGKLPMGHFHSTPLQLAVERGMPALLIWLWILFLYGKTLRKSLKARSQKLEVRSWKPESQIERGIMLGCFGSLIGFFTSGLVHYNLGDGEVAMIFYLLMGIGIFMAKTDDLKEVNESEQLPVE